MIALAASLLLAAAPASPAPVLAEPAPVLAEPAPPPQPERNVTSPDLTPPDLALEPEESAPLARSVYRLRPALDVPLTLGALAGAIVPNQFPTRLIRRSCPCDPAEVNAFDRFAIPFHSKGAGIASDVTVALAVIGPAFADALWVGLTPAFRDDLVVFVETLAVNGALVTGVKYVTQRPLPVTYANRGIIAEQAQGYRSFYSGHTSTVVAALTAAAWTVTLRDGPRVWPWLAVAAGGTSVAVERVAAGRHFPSDVLVGAVAGFGVGTLVPLLHARAPSFSIAPVGRGLAVTIPFR